MNYVAHLKKDKKLTKLLDAATPFQLKKKRNICNYLCASIISQQLSVKVADTIYNRFLLLFDGKQPTAKQILEMAPETLRSIGLSNAKVQYVKNVAAFDLEKGMEWKKLNKMSDDEVISYLTEIKGVGTWTVEMLLMFALGREDVFSPGDLGLQNAMMAIYKLDKTDKKKFMQDILKISAKWSPYRTYASIHLWRWKDLSRLVV